jgi:nitrate/nitrite-specific signal transduction histidine kinase
MSASHPITCVRCQQCVSLPNLMLCTSCMIQYPQSRLLTRLVHAGEEPETDLEDCRKRLEALLSITEATGSELPLYQLYQQVLRTVFDVTGYSSGAIRLYNPQQRVFSLVAQRGMNPRMLEDLQHIPDDVSFQADVARTLKPAWTTDLPNDPRLLSAGELEIGVKYLVCVPLLASNRLVGTMELAADNENAWTASELRFLASIGRQVGASIQTVKLSEQSRDLAILQERERLSRELHDGLAQTITVLRMRAEEALYCLEEDDVTSAEEALEQITHIAQLAYRDIHDDIVGLRVNPGQEHGLLAALTDYFEKFQEQWGIKVQFVSPDSLHSPLPLLTEIQLIRIIQEAMTNVRRHARASQVMVVFTSNETSIDVTLSDDGCGFDQTEKRDGHFGLHVMKERAASVNGEVTIRSQPDRGTQIGITVPRYVLYDASDVTLPNSGSSGTTSDGSNG